MPTASSGVAARRTPHNCPLDQASPSRGRSRRPQQLPEPRRMWGRVGERGGGGAEREPIREEGRGGRVGRAAVGVGGVGSAAVARLAAPGPNSRRGPPSQGSDQRGGVQGAARLARGVGVDVGVCPVVTTFVLESAATARHPADRERHRQRQSPSCRRRCQSSNASPADAAGGAGGGVVGGRRRRPSGPTLAHPAARPTVAAAAIARLGPRPHRRWRRRERSGAGPFRSSPGAAGATPHGKGGAPVAVLPAVGFESAAAAVASDPTFLPLQTETAPVTGKMKRRCWRRQPHVAVVAADDATGTVGAPTTHP